MGRIALIAGLRNSFTDIAPDGAVKEAIFSGSGAGRDELRNPEGKGDAGGDAGCCGASPRLVASATASRNAVTSCDAHSVKEATRRREWLLISHRA